MITSSEPDGEDAKRAEQILRDAAGKLCSLWMHKQAPDIRRVLSLAVALETAARSAEERGVRREVVVGIKLGALRPT